MLRTNTAFATVCVALMFALVGCGGSMGEAGEVDSGWTVVEGELTLEEDLVVTDGDGFYFGWIADLSVSGDGRIYVADSEEHHVKVLSPKGELLETVGREGEGPGEFQNMQELVVGPGDSLYVYTGGRRVSVFEPGPSHAFVRAIPMDRAGGPPPRNMMVCLQGDFLFLYENVPRPGDDLETPHVAAVRRVDHRGAPGDTLATVPAQEMVMEEVGEYIAYVGVPFGRGPRVAYGSQGRLHAGWTDSLSVHTYAISGERVRDVSVPFDPVAVTRSDRERFLKEQPERFRKVLRNHVHDTKPAFEVLLIDDRGRYWFKRPTEDPEHADWWVADPEAQHVVVVPLPTSVDLMVVHDGYAYGRAESEAGAPALVRYRVIEE